MQLILNFLKRHILNCLTSRLLCYHQIQRGNYKQIINHDPNP